MIDEIQDLDAPLIAALLSVQHLANQREWPFYVAGAGLPNLPSVLSESRSYAERLFNYRSIGPLPRPAAESALAVPRRNSVRPSSQPPETYSWTLPAAIPTSFRNTATPCGRPHPRRSPPQRRSGCRGDRPPAA